MPNPKLDGRVDINAYIGSGLRVREASESRESQCETRGERRSGTTQRNDARAGVLARCGSACGSRFRRNARRLRNACYIGKGATLHVVGNGHVIERLAHPRIEVGHDSTSCNCFLPRASHEYTVFTGASTICAISGAV